MDNKCMSCEWCGYDRYSEVHYCYNYLLCENFSQYKRCKAKERIYANMFVDDMKEKDNIKPSHYNSGKYDIIWFCQYHNISFDIGNIMKYIFRAGKKDKAKELEDLRKAKEYLERRIEFVEAKEK